jgi:DNA-binding response OmpR family regulator
MESNWNIHEAHDVQDVEQFFRSGRAEVILCHSSLADGSWKDILERVSDLPSPPHLVVTSETADEFLWAEVLNLGGYDVIAQPFWKPEVVRTLNSALWRRTGPAAAAS